MESLVGLPGTVQKVLLSCGIFASLLKVGADLLAVKLWKGYNFFSQSISELSAYGAPTRSLVLSLDLLYSVLMLAFSAGVWQLAGQNLLMRIAAGLIAGNALISAGVSLFLPMRIDQGGIPTASAIHVVLMAIGVFCFLFAIGLGGAATHGWLRYLSFGILTVYILLTVGRFLMPAPTTPAGLPAPTMGVQERTMVAGYLLWIIALAIQQLTRAGN